MLPFIADFFHRRPPPRSPQPRLDRVRRLRATCGAFARALIQQQGLQVCMPVRALAELGAASIPLHEVLATPLACRGDARDAGAAPRAFHPPRAPLCSRPVLADCSRYAQNEVYEHACYYMSKVVGTR